MSDIEKRIEAFCRQISVSGAIDAEIQAELCDHLREKVEEYLRQGMGEHMALKLAFGDFGDFGKTNNISWLMRRTHIESAFLTIFVKILRATTGLGVTLVFINILTEDSTLVFDQYYPYLQLIASAIFFVFVLGLSLYFSLMFILNHLFEEIFAGISHHVFPKGVAALFQREDRSLILIKRWFQLTFYGCTTLYFGFYTEFPLKLFEVRNSSIICIDEAFRVLNVLGYSFVMMAISFSMCEAVFENEREKHLTLSVSIATIPAFYYLASNTSAIPYCSLYFAVCAFAGYAYFKWRTEIINYVSRFSLRSERFFHQDLFHRSVSK